MKNMTRTCAAGLVLVLSAGLARAGERLTLEQSKALALRNNVAMKNGRLETEAAREAKRAAFTKYFPSVSATGLALEADDPLMEITSGGGDLPVYDGDPANLPNATQFAYFPSTTMGLLGSLKTGMVTAVQPVFAGGRIVNGNRLAALGVEASEDRARLDRNEVLHDTERQYWQIVSLAEKMRTLESYEALLRRLQAQVEDAWNAGLVMKNDLLKVRLKLSEVLLNKSKVENGRSLAVMAFCRHLGIAHDPALELSDPLVVEGSPEACRVDHKAALESRPEYKLLQASVRAETLKTRLTRGEYLPQLGVGVAGMYMKMDDAKGRTSGLVFGTLSVPLSGWWGGAHALGEQRAREEIARNTLSDGGELLLLQMEKAWKDLADADRELALCRDSEAQADENLKVNQDGYDNGLITVSDLLEAQALRQQARDLLTEAMAAYRVKLAGYLQVTGR
ncbi:MAG TPA: TolC family protein [Candidatus Aminicenantes bacterium]|nr:TolC family protein [Candidatus Aminicenantes bacterium]HRY63756.1 TolC family protein [Candidatus Aminicenantes bacterium]HRZ70669.1 TolC family protein [Candidatus Aminicenantes bacterium]